MKDSESKENSRRQRIVNHFNNMAEDYDRYKHRAAYYHNQVKMVLRETLGDVSQSRVIEIGCGTGAILAWLNPGQGLGMDISARMVEQAALQWKDKTHLQFEVGEAETAKISGHWDYIFMADVLEHLYDSEAAISHLSSTLPSGCHLVITWANSWWSPILHLLERLKLKMPEGDHKWEARRTVKNKLEKNGLCIRSHGTRCLVPAAIPGADWINRNFYKWPVIRTWGLIRFMVCSK